MIMCGLQRLFYENSLISSFTKGATKIKISNLNACKHNENDSRWPIAVSRCKQYEKLYAINNPKLSQYAKDFNEKLPIACIETTNYVK